MPDPHVFEYQGTFELPLARDRAWDILGQTEHYQSWWPWMRHLEVGGEPLERGSSFSFLVVAPIPFTMRLRVEVANAEEPESIEARVRGDLSGTATMEFEEHGSDTKAHIGWTVEVVKPSLRPVARVMRPLLLWGQTWAVDVALRGFRRHLGDPGGHRG